MADRIINSKYQGKIKHPTGFQLCAEEWFDTADVSATNSLCLGQIPSLELDLVEIWSNVTDGFIELFRNTAAGGYALSGSQDYRDRYITFGSDITFPASEENNIHTSYRINELTVNSEISLTTGDIAFNVDSAYSDIGGVTKKAIVDIGRYVLTSISKVSGQIQTPGDWTYTFNELTLDTGNISIYTGQIAGYTNGISISLGSIDAKAPFVQANLTSVSGQVQTPSDWTLAFYNISEDTGNISIYTGQISGYTEGISLSLDNIGIVQLPTQTTTAGNFKVSIEEAPIPLIANINITSVSGEVQTPSDWTNTFNNLTEDTGNISISVGQIAGYTNGISISLGTIDAKLQNISGSVGGISTSIGSIDGKLVDSNIIGQVKMTDGTTIAGIDPTTTAILVKEVTGAGEIANVNITSVTGTAQTGGDWTGNFNAIQSNTDRIVIANTTQIAGELSINNVGITLATGNLHIGEVSISNAGLTLATGTANIGTVNGSEVSINNIGITLATGNLHIGEVSVNNAGITLSTGTANIGYVHDSEVYVKNTGLTISSGSITSTVYPANATSWTTGQITVPNPGTTVQLDSVVIPSGFTGVIKAKANNTGTISIGDTSAKALSTSIGHYKLLTNEGISLGVTNLNKIYMDAWVANEGIEYFTEAT